MDSAEVPSAAVRRASSTWHGLWGVALVLCALAWPTEDRITFALLAAAVPGVIGFFMRWPLRGWPQGLASAAWPLGVGAALWLTGGISGPLAPLAIAPALAMAAIDGRRLIAAGVAATTAVVASIALAGAARLVGPPPVLPGWMPLTLLCILVVALGASLLIARARAAERENALSDEAERLKSLLEASPWLTLRLDAHGQVAEVFSGALEDADLALRGAPFESLACDDHQGAARAAVALARRLGAASVGFAPPGAPDRWLAVELRGQPHGVVVASVRDASLERAREAWLEQARADAEAQSAGRARFLANMSHELRTPLNAIIGFSDIMRTRLFGPMPERYAEYAGLIHESGGHLLDLINDVLDMSKIEADRFELSLEAFDAREAVSAALRLTRVQADAAKIQLRGSLPAAPLDVEADRRALKQIVLNLVSNALKFTPAGGAVSVAAKARDGALEIAVSDTGIGISKTDLERLGRPYEQAGGAGERARGTGLGLSLVRAFAELHGGAMTLESTIGEGTTVTVRLPVLQVRAAPEPIPEPASPPAPTQRVANLGDNVIAFNPQR